MIWVLGPEARAKHQPRCHRGADKAEEVTLAMIQFRAVHLGNSPRDTTDILGTSLLHRWHGTIPKPPKDLYYLGTGALKQALKEYYYLGNWGARD